MSDQARFDDLVSRYYQAWFRYHPELAVDIGVSGYEEQLALFDDDEIGALTALNEKVLSTLEEIRLDTLSPASQLDFQLLYGSAMIEGHELVEMDWRISCPQRFLPVNAIYQLTVKPVQNRDEALRSRLRAVPGYLRRARTYLVREPERIPAVWLEAAIQEAQGGVEYFTSLKSHPDLAKAGLNGELDEAGQALQGFMRFLERDIGARAQGDFAVGRQRFERLLQHRHFLDLDADELFAFGQQLYDRTLVELEEVTRQLRGDTNITAMTEQLQTQVPQGDQLLDIYRDTMRQSRQFIIDRDLVTFPPVEKLDVVATPVFLQHQIPFAAYMEPAASDRLQQGYYYVTPVTEAGALGEHNVVAIKHTSVHESYPGHHLQFVTANLSEQASSLPRLANPSATLYEGWALYCEQLMMEQGFLDEPESRFLLLKDRLWRALRIMVDVDIQTRGKSLQETAQQMQSLLGFTHGQAMADLVWYTMAPTVPMGYGVGWALINAARDCQRLEDKNFSLKQFHDALLAEGSVALPAVIKKQFGPARWQSVRQMVFTPAH